MVSEGLKASAKFRGSFKMPGIDAIGVAMTRTGRWAVNEVKDNIEDILDAARISSPQIIVDSDGTKFVVTHDPTPKRPSAKAFLLRNHIEDKG